MNRTPTIHVWCIFYQTIAGLQQKKIKKETEFAIEEYKKCRKMFWFFKEMFLAGNRELQSPVQRAETLSAPHSHQGR